VTRNRIDFSLVAACNNEEVLQNSLLHSPAAGLAREILVKKGFPSAGLAYNAALAEARGEIVVLAHQDVYLPEGWIHKLGQTLDILQNVDPNWGVLGLFGTEPNGTGQGYIYSTGLMSILGGSFPGVRQVETLDEALLIVRLSSGLRFDDKLPGYHLYGADICLQARSRGMKSYAISACAIHNTNGIGLLPLAYWKAWLYMRREWCLELPVATPCMPITRWGTPALRYLVKRTLRLERHRRVLGRRVSNPEEVWRQLREGGLVV
jgi:hypothetical protein